MTVSAEQRQAREDAVHAAFRRQSELEERLEALYETKGKGALIGARLDRSYVSNDARQELIEILEAL